jgi:hypothetical protein
MVQPGGIDLLRRFQPSATDPSKARGGAAQRSGSADRRRRLLTRALLSLRVGATIAISFFGNRQGIGPNSRKTSSWGMRGMESGGFVRRRGFVFKRRICERARRRIGHNFEQLGKGDKPALVELTRKLVNGNVQFGFSRPN